MHPSLEDTARNGGCIALPPLQGMVLLLLSSIAVLMYNVLHVLLGPNGTDLHAACLDAGTDGDLTEAQAVRGGTPRENKRVSGCRTLLSAAARNARKLCPLQPAIPVLPIRCSP